MKRTAYVLLASVLFLGSASLAFADIEVPSNAPTAPQAHFGFYCNPYNASFISGGSYEQTGGACTYQLTAQDISLGNIFLAVYKGTVGNATLIEPDYGPLPTNSGNVPYSILDTFPNTWSGTQGDTFFAVAVPYNGDVSDVYSANTYFSSGGTAPVSYDTLPWVWGIPPQSPVSVTIPQDGATYSPTDVILVQPSLADLASYVSVIYTLNNAVVDPNLPLPFSTLPSGTNTLVIAATDSVGNITYATSTFMILGSQSPLTVTANDAAMTYGSTLPSLTAALSGFTNGDSPTSNDITGAASCTSTATAASPAGTYPITCTVGTLASAGHYTFNSFVPGTLTVSKAPLTVTADNKSKASGAALPALTATLSGFVNGQTLTTSGVTGSPSCLTIATSASAPGNYPITCTAGTLASTNYSLATFTAGTLTVTPPPDVTPPNIVITNPVKDGVYAKTDLVLLTATVTDASAIAATTYWFGTTKINPAQPLPLSTVTTPSIQAVSVSAKDIYGNTSTTTVKFFVVKTTNSCLLDIISVVVLITQDKTFPDKLTLQNLIDDCSALLKGRHHY